MCEVWGISNSRHRRIHDVLRWRRNLPSHRWPIFAVGIVLGGDGEKAVSIPAGNKGNPWNARVGGANEGRRENENIANSGIVGSFSEVGQRRIGASGGG